MIVARILDGKGRVGQGSCKIKGYDNGDWFPVESFDFGFDPKEEADDSSKPAAPAPVSHKPPTQGGPNGRSGKKGKGDLAKMSIAKQIDSTTCYLMFLAMEERQTKKGVGPNNKREIVADLHVLATVQAGDTANRFIYPTILVHLEAVNILDWKIAASGDGRPTETLSIRYDRAAMIYCATADGQIFMQHGPKGWDQTQNKDYEMSGEFKWKDFKDFLPKINAVIK